MTPIPTDGDLGLSVRTRSDGKHTVAIWGDMVEPGTSVVLTDDQLAILGRVAVARAVDGPSE